MTPDDRGSDYLWDRSGPPDAEIERLERLLAPVAWRPAGLRPTAEGSPVALPRRRVTGRRRWRRYAIAAAFFAAALGIHGWYAHRLQWPDAQPWRIADLRGSVRVDGDPGRAGSGLAPGRVLETGPDGSARLAVARIGELEVGPGSRFMLVETGSGRHRTQLRVGRLWVRIWAPPGWFGVSTPAGDVFDLGCEFLLEAREDGSGSLTVRSGWVQVDNARREVLVPEGARLEFGAGGEPGIPYDLGASEAFRSALREAQAQGARLPPDGEEMRTLLAASRAQDAISLLGLLQAHPSLAEGPLFDRLAAIMPGDARVTRAQIREQGARALHPWWDALPYPRMKRWWVHWPDAFGG